MSKTARELAIRFGGAAIAVAIPLHGRRVRAGWADQVASSAQRKRPGGRWARAEIEEAESSPASPQTRRAPLRAAVACIGPRAAPPSGSGYKASAQVECAGPRQAAVTPAPTLPSTLPAVRISPGQ